MINETLISGLKIKYKKDVAGFFGFLNYSD